MLKKLKPDASRDNLSELHRAAISSRKAVLEYLLGIGANPNDKPNGGSSWLETALWHLSFARFDPYRSKRLKSKYDVSNDLDLVRELLVHGATWGPEDRYHVASLRRTLLECEPDVAIDLLQMFLNHNEGARAIGDTTNEEASEIQNRRALRLGIHLDAGHIARRYRQSGRAQHSR